jgi:two-component system chemotaxis response regulator CheY
MADRKMRILIVDDANLVRLYYRQILEDAGFEVEEAINGLEALERLLVSPADALIVDINMPRMDGVTFLSALRRQPLPLSSIPAFVTSTESSAADVAAARAAGGGGARAAGANFYYVKPIGREDLARYMAMCCGAPR